jgi:hypothetical protein
MKIFGIGLSKTGTTSLNSALEILGYSAKHYPTTPEEIESHDAATDATIARAYRELDLQYPGSKFILTVRDVEKWLQSCRLHFAVENPSGSFRDQLIQDLYGCRAFEETSFRAAYARHLREAQAYFAGREGDLLILDPSDASIDPWEPLCGFLGVPVPSEPFPHQNKSPTGGKLRVLHRRLRRAAKQILRRAGDRGGEPPSRT